MMVLECKLQFAIIVLKQKSRVSPRNLVFRLPAAMEHSMIRRKQLSLCLCLLLWLLGGVLGATPVSAQNPPPASKAEQAKTLIVKIRAPKELGAGILFSLRGGYLFIATASHVVQGSPQELEKLAVEFEFLRGVPVPAERWRDFPKLDLAVLRVDIQRSGLHEAAADPAPVLPFQFLNSSVKVQKGAPVYPIGHPIGYEWYIPTDPARIKEVIAEEIRYEPTCFGGQSGGGVFDEEGHLIGMILRDHTLYCEAISFERICATLEEDWGLVVNHEPLPLGSGNTVPVVPTAPPAPSIAEQQQQLQDLLAQAESYFKLQWYTTPPETNAFDVYCQVLQLDPDNPQALQSIQQMRAFYKSRAEQAEQQGNSPKAIQYYQGYLKIAPNDDEVLDKLLQLQTPAPRPASTPTPRPTARPTATPTPVPQPTPRVTLRSTPRTVSEDEAQDVFGLTIRQFDWGKGWAPQTYIDNQYDDQGEVVIDHATGLTWQKSGSDNYMTYAAAEAYIQDLNRRKFAGYADWRLPTMPELLSLLEPEKSSNGLYINPIFDERQLWCWSSDKRSSSSAWSVTFDRGLVYWRPVDRKYYVRVVHS